MTKTVELTGSEMKVEGLGGQNTAVKNLSAGTIYASTYPNIQAGADNVIEIPAGGGEVVLDANGTVYLLGSGRVQCTGTSYATPNFKMPSQSESGGGGGTGDVTKAYVDAQDTTNLGAAKAYTNTAIGKVNDDIAALQRSKADKSEIPTALPASKLETARAIDGISFDGTKNIIHYGECLTAANNNKKTVDIDGFVLEEGAEISVQFTLGGSSTNAVILNVSNTGEKFVVDSEGNTFANNKLNRNVVYKLIYANDYYRMLGAIGINAAKVNGHTVNADVPANAKFTDTTYTNATTSKAGLMSAEDKTKLDDMDMSGKMDKNNPTGTGAFSMNRSSVSDIGDYSFAEGNSTAAYGEAAHAEGNATRASGNYAHSEGYDTDASGESSHAEGHYTRASGRLSHAEGGSTKASGELSHAEGWTTIANGVASHSEGAYYEEYTGVNYQNVSTTANGKASHAEGIGTTAGTSTGGEAAHSEGYATVASGDHSHAEGESTVVSGKNSHAEGGGTTVTGDRAHAEGSNTTANGNDSHTEGYSSETAAGNLGAHAEGGYCFAVGRTAHAQGYATKAEHNESFSGGNRTLTGRDLDTVLGRLNIAKSDSLLTIGYGSGTLRSNSDKPDNMDYNTYQRSGDDVVLKNLFRVNTAGAVYGVGAFNTSGADYAEYIKPWFDSNTENEDRRGYFVTIKDGKLRFAEPNDYIVGITSGNPSVVGNGDEDWLGRWQRDEFNELVYQNVEVDDYEDRTDENGNIVSVKVGSHIEKQTIQNPEYDNSQEYVERKDRPEWSYVGMIGVLPLRDDGTCVAGGFAKCGEHGVATAANEWECHKMFFVIERINDHIISVEMR